MEKDKIIILEDRGLISVSGLDAKDFLQNILTNDMSKVSDTNSLFAAIFTPQGKYLYEFFLFKSKNCYFLDCDDELTEEIIEHLTKYRLRSKVEIKDISLEYSFGIISLEKFKELQSANKTKNETILFEENHLFIDPRTNKLGARIISSLERLRLIIKKLNLIVDDNKNYLNKAYLIGIPIKGTKNLKNQLFGLEANFEELKAIDFKKGCYVGQENTARMKLKNKLRRKLLPIETNAKLKIGDDITFNNFKIGKILISDPYPFALINLFSPNFSYFKNKEVLIDGKKIRVKNIS